MHCEIVYDGNSISLPEGLGNPREDQLRGGNLDILTELSGRVCYDSFTGKGRSSVEYHKHIIEVGHLSVQEHANITFQSTGIPIPEYLSCCEAILNRPGIWATKIRPKILSSQDRTFNLRITANLRAIREWFSYPRANSIATALGKRLQFLTKDLAPIVMQDDKVEDVSFPLDIVPPEFDEEIWLSFYISDVSRGLTHELVRHGDWTAISQRSTRYVDEDQSPWSWHPLITHWAATTDNKDFLEYEAKGKALYASLVKSLQEYLVNKGIDKFTARKQSRGAARGALGNALSTELIFSASLSQWKRMIRLRAHSASDAEIRLLFDDVYNILKVKYPDRFNQNEWTTEPAQDGIGFQVNYNSTPTVALAA